MKKTIFALLALLLLACGEEHFIPKPPTYLKLELPGHQYESYVDSCGYSFDLPTIYTVEKAPTDLLSSGKIYRNSKTEEKKGRNKVMYRYMNCLLYTSPSPRD